MERRYDVLVIGSGIAGLFYALKITELYPRVRVAIITKKSERETSTNRAQGGIAAVLNKKDSFESHIKDTLQAGAGLNRKDVVEQIVEAGPSVIEELISYGVRFTTTDGALHLGREGGHSSPRVAHAKDFTGRELERSLLAACRSKSASIDIFRNHLMLELITYSNGGQKTCTGAFVFSESGRSFDFFYAPVTMLASGGLGQVYYHTTNPKIATGDGVAAAHRAGVSVANMEFVQFHPTALYNPGRWPFLISEAVRGEGGRLKSVDGRYIMENVHEMKDLAPRDVVARVIDKELKATGEDYVYLDVSQFDTEFIKNRFPNIYKQCLKRGFDITERAIPVVPSAHYSCGGVICNVHGETELAGFYVSGEVAMSGMHGANRLASNSLLEAVVMARFAAVRCVDYLKQTHLPRNIPIDNSPYSSLKSPDQKILIAHDRRQLNSIMSDFVGIVRTSDHLKLAMKKVLRIRKAIEQHNL
ncbi:MAG: L-aspartate oxidase, partial [candidate division Zixibacteria bacterium]|nr:L-aspartate oxidase [candidate division Zixibacteria bacterium]